MFSLNQRVLSTQNPKSLIRALKLGSIYLCILSEKNKTRPGYNTKEKNACIPNSISTASLNILSKRLFNFLY